MNCSRTNEKKKKKKKRQIIGPKKKKCLFLSDCPDETFFPVMRLENFFSKQVN